MGIDYGVIGMRIRKIRNKKQVTQEQLAEVTSLSVVYISNIENAKRSATLDTFVSIVNALGCTVDDLLDGYLVHKSTLFFDNMATVLSDCNPQEKLFIYNMIRALKETIRVTPFNLPLH